VGSTVSCKLAAVAAPAFAGRQQPILEAAGRRTAVAARGASSLCLLARSAHLWLLGLVEEARFD
jgi:hypothetical protein